MRLVPLGLLLLLAGCGEGVIRQSPGPGSDEVRLAEGQVIAEDGYRLPLRHWPAEDEPRAIVLGIHGFNEHGGTFQVLAEALAPRGITLYAHDQRGFGTTAQRRLWPGHERLAADVTLLAGLLSERHPEPPLYLVGHSMGGAVAILALSGDDPPPVDGSVLIAPAVWGFEAMPLHQARSHRGGHRGLAGRPQCGSALRARGRPPGSAPGPLRSSLRVIYPKACRSPWIRSLTAPRRASGHGRHYRVAPGRRRPRDRPPAARYSAWCPMEPCSRLPLPASCRTARRREASSCFSGANLRVTDSVRRIRRCDTC
ncbi:alpha/beta fold hydrolase [Halomonas ramblicola]|uniref:alpha/beta fold hydrolase n=1 Tax=Halomonas ramblicola TaxID=747349 RepID=UPI0025B39A8E|nr:alpha/beta fold hydrolase [Halomonas ramblicola]MDN3520539.1 alpha/beta fold hydrolase [Halomonas ramblicola]